MDNFDVTRTLADAIPRFYNPAVDIFRHFSKINKIFRQFPTFVVAPIQHDVPGSESCCIVLSMCYPGWSCMIMLCCQCNDQDSTTNSLYRHQWRGPCQGRCSACGGILPSSGWSWWTGLTTTQLNKKKFFLTWYWPFQLFSICEGHHKIFAIGFFSLLSLDADRHSSTWMTMF